MVGDILSSKMATNMWRGVESFAKSLVVDLGFVLLLLVDFLDRSWNFPGTFL